MRYCSLLEILFSAITYRTALGNNILYSSCTPLYSSCTPSVLPLYQRHSCCAAGCHGTAIATCDTSPLTATNHTLRVRTTPTLLQRPNSTILVQPTTSCCTCPATNRTNPTVTSTTPLHKRGSPHAECKREFASTIQSRVREGTNVCLYPLPLSTCNSCPAESCHDPTLPCAWKCHAWPYMHPCLAWICHRPGRTCSSLRTSPELTHADL